mmetsp:Transcript_32244/g.102814  ORF Transcript_32244/g.102814 Transcript_32244/m.102814 type:complete len:330 (-) Transcript_32244:189-1178(-)
MAPSSSVTAFSFLCALLWGTTSAYITSVAECPRTTARPQLALCLAGHARTFGDGKIVDGLLQNLVEPFGANVTTFLYLKLHDHSTKGKTRTENLAVAVDLTRGHGDLVEAQASRLPNVASAEIVEDDVTFTQPRGCGHGFRYTADNSTGTAWRAEETWQMLVGQLYNQYWCGRAIESYARRTGVRFDVVLKSRPDVTFTSPMPPYCAFDYATKACSARDWMFMIPGSVAVDALKRGFQEFQSCRTIMNRNRTKIAEIVVRASGIGKELTTGMASPDERCQKCSQKFKHTTETDCPGCHRKPPGTTLRLLRKPGVPSGSIPGLLPRDCGF